MNTIISGIVRIEQPGKPEVLRYEQTEISQPGEGEVLIGQKAIGVNFLDVFFRNGTFPMPAYPALIGLEAAGIVEQTGYVFGQLIIECAAINIAQVLADRKKSK